MLKSTSPKAGNCPRSGGINMLLSFAAVAVLLLFIIYFLKTIDSKKRKIAYKKKTALFTPAERSFLGVLDQCLDSQFRVFGKIRLADIIAPDTYGDSRIGLNQIIQRHVDFVVCKSGDLSLVAIIELDDKSHLSESRKRKDTFLNDSLESAGIPVIRFTAKGSYSTAEVKSKLSPLFSTVPAPASKKA